MCLKDKSVKVSYPHKGLTPPCLLLVLCGVDTKQKRFQWNRFVYYFFAGAPAFGRFAP